MDAINHSPRRIVLLGATGSIGKNTLQVIRAHPDKLTLVGIANNQNVEGLAAIAEEFSVPHSVCFQRDGLSALIDLVTRPDVDCVVVAAVGTVGLQPTLAAIRAGKMIALASKEVLVMAGKFVMQAIRQAEVSLLPVDSEHNAIFQCLQGNTDTKALRRLILTASGGAFRDFTLEQMRHIEPHQALQHPNWSMGPKITVDSATMANKGLEMIEAQWLFDVRPDQIEVTLHPQSLVHSMVEYVDGSILAQLSPPSMTFAIQYALLYPERCAGSTPTLDFSQLIDLRFSPPDPARYPCLQLARNAMQSGGTAPAIFNAANEIAVDAFLKKKIPFLAISEVIDHTMHTLPICDPDELEAILEVDKRARITANAFIEHSCR
jgi:1-deoxy-D-xylulose-5-phosphate reductoisomerase